MCHSLLCIEAMLQAVGAASISTEATTLDKPLCRSRPAQMTGPKDVLHVHISPHPQHGFTLSYQVDLEANGGSKRYRVECSPDAVQRSRVLKDLAASLGSPCMTSLPIRQAAFSAWHTFDMRKKSSSEELYDVLQVCLL